MINFSSNSRALAHRLSEIKKAGNDLKPVFELIGGRVADSVDVNFTSGGRHNGDPSSGRGGSESWAPWSEAWQKRRDKLGKGTGTILTLDGGLAGSISFDASKNEVVITSAKEYAQRMHFGGNGVPARPFLLVQDEDVEEFLELTANMILGK